MTTDDLFNRWQAARRRPVVPGDFADRVMERVRRRAAAPAPPGPSSRSILACLGKAAAIAAASLVWASHATLLFVAVTYLD